MRHAFLLLSLLPLLASAAPEEEAPVPYEYSISTINARSIGLLPRQELMCPGVGYSKCPGNYCCRPGLRCDGNACCPIGRICSRPASCISRSDPKCASSEDCCPTSRPYCTVNDLGGATCSDQPPLGGGSGGSDTGDDELPPVQDSTTSTRVVPTTSSSSFFDEFTSTRTRPTFTSDDFTSTRTSSSSSSSSSSLGDLFDSFTSSIGERLSPTADSNARGADGDTSQSAGGKNVMGMALVAGLGVLVGGAVML